jgi:hypothetical protein
MYEDERHIAEVLGVGGLAETAEPAPGAAQDIQGEGEPTVMTRPTAAHEGHSARLKWGAVEWTSIVQAAATVGLVVYAAWSASISGSQVKQEAQIADAQIRPWIEITDVSVAGPMTFGDANGLIVPTNIPLRITLKNKGHSAAQDIKPFAIPVFYYSGAANALPSSSDERKRCDGFMKAGDIQFLNKTLFADESFAPLETAATGAVINLPTSAAIVICVIYRGASGTKYMRESYGSLSLSGKATMTPKADQSAKGVVFTRAVDGDLLL